MNRIILLIDDDRDDAVLFAEAFSALGGNISFSCVESAAEGLHILSGMEMLPSLILLDAGMPRINGWEFLTLIKKDPRYTKVPIVMTATSSRQDGIRLAGDLGALAYMVKPSDFNDLKWLMQQLCSGLDGFLDETLFRLHQARPDHLFFFGKRHLEDGPV